MNFLKQPMPTKVGHSHKMNFCLLPRQMITKNSKNSLMQQLVKIISSVKMNSENSKMMKYSTHNLIHLTKAKMEDPMEK